MEFHQERAIYLQIADYICEKILLREWVERDRIPSVRELAVEIEVNPNTVVKTYGFLEDANIIQKQRGIGYFVADGGYDKTLALKKDNFLSQELPFFLKTMRLLKLQFEDLAQLHDFSAEAID